MTGPRRQCTFEGEYMGRCTAWEGHSPDERTGASHWRSEADAERWASGAWPVLASDVSEPAPEPAETPALRNFTRGVPEPAGVSPLAAPEAPA